MAAQAAAMAVNFFTSLLGNYAQQDAVEAQGIIDSANADAANTVRNGNNLVAAAQQNLARVVQSINNNNQLRAQGKQSDALTTNILRVADQAVRGSLQVRLNAAQQLGAVTAQAAARGVGGTSVDLLKSSLQRSADATVQAIDSRLESQKYDTQMQLGNVAFAMQAGRDMTSYNQGLDYSVTQTPFRSAKYSLANQSPVLAAALTTLGGNQQNAADVLSDVFPSSGGSAPASTAIPQSGALYGVSAGTQAANPSSYYSSSSSFFQTGNANSWGFSI